MEEYLLGRRKGNFETEVHRAPNSLQPPKEVQKLFLSSARNVDFNPTFKNEFARCAAQVLIDVFGIDQIGIVYADDAKIFEALFKMLQNTRNDDFFAIVEPDFRVNAICFAKLNY